MRSQLLVAGTALLLAAGLIAQEIKLPQNPLKGQIVYEEKGCVQCHAIGGYGGSEGPDLSKELYFGSVLELATIIWNHTPQMNRKYRQLRMDRPMLTEEEMLDLFGFLYYLRYLGEPGGVAKGKRLLENKGCIACHKVAGQGGDVAPAFEKVQHFASPLYIVQAMWNHGPRMQEQIRVSELKFPTLTGQDINDMTAYIRRATMGTTEVRMSPGDPTKGRDIFKQKNCGNCHLVEGRARLVGPTLSRIELKKGVTEIASLMWNHGPVMMEHMKKEAIEWPQFEGNEMADLIAYLYFLGFEDKPGDPSRGEKVFRANGCTDCHRPGGGGRAPDLAGVARFESPIQMIQLMWNHATEMEDLFISQNRDWPELQTSDMRDIYSYLRKVTKR